MSLGKNREVPEDPLHWQQMDRNLDEWFAAYRQASTPAPGAEFGSAEFLPGMWRKIEARRNPVLPWMSWSRRVLLAAGAACLLLGLAVWNPLRHSVYYETSYLETLQEADDSVVMAALHPAAPVVETPIGLE